VKALVRKEKNQYFEPTLKQTSLNELTNDFKALELVLFQSRFIVGLPWDPSEWIWKAGQGLKELTIFGYLAKIGYRSSRVSWED
jgi:hypothetical protein